MSQSTPASLAAEVWRRFAGMFGREAVARKYGEQIPEEWPAMMSRLNEYQVQRGIRMLAYSGKQHVPSLPEFVKLCRDAEHDHGGPARPALDKPPEWNGDKWDQAANIHLLGYVTRAVRVKRGFDAAQTGVLVAMKNRWAELMRDGEAKGEGIPVADQVHCWNECMRQAEEIIAKEAA